MTDGFKELNPSEFDENKWTHHDNTAHLHICIPQDSTSATLRESHRYLDLNTALYAVVDSATAQSQLGFLPSLSTYRQHVVGAWAGVPCNANAHEAILSDWT